VGVQQGSGLKRRAGQRVNSIFSKLGLSEEKLLSRRVAAVLAYLRASPN
jgi:hypothetical protein